MTRPANRRRGEVAAMIDGEPRVLCLTLGALAELEDAFGADNLADLLTRFSSGRLKAADIMRIVGAGLRGGGAGVGDAEVAAMRIDGGTQGCVTLVAELLSATFGAGGKAEPPNP